MPVGKMCKAMRNQQKNSYYHWLKEPRFLEREGKQQQRNTKKKEFDFILDKSMEIYGSYRIQQKLETGRPVSIPVLI